MSEIRWNWAYLSLGSNTRPELHLPLAVRMLADSGRVLAVSRVWESAPYGETNSASERAATEQAAANFLNAAVLLETLLSAEAICVQAVPTLEAKLGRVRDPRDKNAPRTIDVDLSLYNRDILTVGHRQIPDPEILNRAFVAVPLAELDPDYLLPKVERTLAQIAAEIAPAFSLRERPDVVLR
jgi:2-amino-4-hydroxy-6-hydroxymethyldihydropteridine diphosphokinase